MPSSCCPALGARIAANINDLARGFVYGQSSVLSRACVQVLLDGRVTNGTALNETAATGSAANGDLGPGAILVNGTTNSGTGAAFEHLASAGWPLCRVKQSHCSTAAAAGGPSLERGKSAVLMQLSGAGAACPTAGVSGVAYPVVAVTPRGVIVNRNNGVNITGDLLPRSL